MEKAKYNFKETIKTRLYSAFRILMHKTFVVYTTDDIGGDWCLTNNVADLNEFADFIKNTICKVKPQAEYFQHFKGGYYKLLGVAKHSETQEEFVIYQSMEDDQIWIRPKVMFFETIVRDGKTIQRFKKVESKVYE